MGGGDGKGKGGGKGKGAGKGAGKGKDGPAPAAGPALAVSDEVWGTMSGKQRKMYMRTQNMVMHVSGPAYQQPKKKKQDQRIYKEAGGSGPWWSGIERWYNSKGPWVPCQNPACTGCK